MKNSKIEELSPEKFKEIVSKCDKIKDIAIQIGCLPTSLNYKIINVRLLKENLKVTKKTKWSTGKIKQPLDNILVENSTYTNRAHLKIRLIEENIIEYKCEKCNNIGNWLSKKLILQVDHINGVNNDNRICNLRFLCPNCHSQTETFCRPSLNKK